MRRNLRLFVPLAAGLLVVTFACSTPMELGAVVDSGADAGSSGNHLGEVADADTDANTSATSESEVGFCPTSECPTGHVTCPNNPFPCAVDLASDDTNCGSCGNWCPSPAGQSAFSTCMDGKCRFVCEPNFADCNALTEDGCEVRTIDDRNNCGTCGHVCPNLHTCAKGSCICAVTGSCGECGHLCPASTDPPFPTGWNAEYGCVQGQCNKPMCTPFFADCNGDFTGIPPFEGDGCETALRGDPNNCGGCGIKCAPGETCPGSECVCQCGSVCFSEERLNDDVANCGACRNICEARRNSTAICDHGVCNYVCAANWGDCDGNIPGCETNFLSDPLNCGACGIRCDGIDGQACVDGKCTTKECRVIK